MPHPLFNEEPFYILGEILNDPYLDTWSNEETHEIRVLDLIHRPYPYGYYVFLYDPDQSLITLVNQPEDIEICLQNPPYKVSGNVAIYIANLSTIEL